MSGGPQEPIVRVAELDRRLRRAVENASGDYWVEGELGSLKRASSGHVYFTLKDEEEDAIIDCVMYRFDALRAQRHLVNGAKIQLWGRVTVWAPRGRLQLVGQRVRPSGRGSLLAALEALKHRLEAEGLFAPERKRALPEAPSVVGVVTSRTGAALQDIASVAFRRGAVRIVLAAASVQGEGAPESLIRALDLIERYPALDVLIVGRGGGSEEDLAAFNDERVVRRLARVRVPVVSAVGHDVDLSLTDLVADVRAATPSQAAELVVPDGAARRVLLARALAALARSARAAVDARRAATHALGSSLSDPRFLMAERQQQLDELRGRLARRIQRTGARRAQALAGVHARLVSRHPRAVLAENRRVLAPLWTRLEAAVLLGLGARRARLADRGGRLDTLSPLSVLGRGYAIALRDDGSALRRARDARAGEHLALRLGEGTLDARVERSADGGRREHDVERVREPNDEGTS